MDNLFEICPVCLTAKSIMVKESWFECSRCGATLSFEDYEKERKNEIRKNGN